MVVRTMWNNNSKAQTTPRHSLHLFVFNKTKKEKEPEKNEFLFHPVVQNATHVMVN